MTRCITDYLVQEHQELSHLLNELQEQLRVLPLARDHRGTAERLSGLTRAVGEALRAHLVREEQILYPALERHVQGIAATLDRMRQDHDAGEETEKAFLECLACLLKGGRNRQEVMQSGRQYIQWLRKHLLDENGRLFPMVERGLNPETQQEVRRANGRAEPRNFGASRGRLGAGCPGLAGCGTTRPRRGSGDPDQEKL